MSCLKAAILGAFSGALFYVLVANSIADRELDEHTYQTLISALVSHDQSPLRSYPVE